MNLEFNETERKSIRATFCPGFTDEQFEVCMTFCKVRNLLPGKHVIFSLRTSKEWDEAARAKVQVTKIIFMTTIDASRLVAQRTGQYNGQAPEQYIYLDNEGLPSIVSEIPLPQLPLPPKGSTALPREPWAVKTTIFRKDFSQPISSVARFDAYAATYNGQLNEMWARRGPEQLAKCSEMLSLRKGFPEELGGLYLAEEFKQDPDEIASQPISPAVAIPPPPVVPKVNQTPAQPTSEPRPGENSLPVTTAEYHVDSLPATLPTHSGEVLVVTPPSETERPKRGRKPKEELVQKMDKPLDQGITEEDVAILDGQPRSEAEEFDHEANQKEAREFVEGASDISIPTKDQQKAFATRARAMVEPGVDIGAIGAYTLGVGQKKSSNLLTTEEWTKALDALEAAKKEGRLKEVVKEAPVAPF